MRNHLKRGVAIEYALIVMLIVFAFAAVIVTSSILSNTKANEYGSYVTQKAHVDEIGSLCRLYYVDDADNLTEIESTAAGYGFTYEGDTIPTSPADGDVVTATVTETSSDEVLLTMQFTYESGGNSFALTAYVYGAI